MMLRRRHRLFLVVALAIVILLYRLSQHPGAAQPPKPVAVQQPQRPVDTPLSNTKRPDTLAQGEPSAGPHDGPRPAPDVKGDKAAGVANPATRPARGGTGADQKQPLSPGAAADGRPKKSTHAGIDSKWQHDKEKPLGRTDDSHPPTPVSGAAPLDTTPAKVSWTKPKEHFPLPKKSIITLPAGSAKKMPKIQHDFPAEAEGPKKKRLARQAAVKEEIRRSWAGYTKYAWMHDELSPVSNRSRDPFCGWAATLVDSLDTLWIAGLKDEFDEAATAAKSIDFTYTERSSIPIFETTIRYLGGLVAAYDVSGGASGKHAFLLDKAVELAEILMGIFDTPNRMPILYYNWRPERASKRKRADQAGMAELATLTMEFTRLAQVTGQHKYYDAVDRITNGLIDMQRSGTLMPGLFPQDLDISGCNKTAATEKRLQSISDHPPGTEKDVVRRSEVPDEHENLDDCVPQGFVSARYRQSYHMGGGQDSAYEYFGKEYLLLGGREQKYQKLYEDTVDGINKHLLYRPMIPGDWDIIFPAKVGLTPGDAEPSVEYEVTHLTCFIGGMYALGGKLFGREKDLKYAEKLTNGCVWAYQSTASGIMPESGRLLACPTFAKCSYNESLWLETHGISPASRIQQKATHKAGGGENEASAAKRDTDSLKSASKRAVVPDDPSDAGLAGRRDFDVEADMAAEDSLVPSLARDGESAETKLEIPVLKKDYRPRARAQRVTNPMSQDSEWSENDGSRRERVQRQRMPDVPPGYSSVNSKQYILRPEAIESVWYMYRITGDASWMEKGWTMWEATMKATRTASANSAIDNVLSEKSRKVDAMESFWLAETLKYYYLLFSEPSVISLDDWVLNTEAHPFKLKKA
ncbi:hypothetical protein E4U42_001149 [Claviceps africana]|uniref:alpha-1,2-Mannosidase n=1 Tax=Claviceps africana TaxID=83212 RepID=A0A8K0IZR8_9HYPO|nr:hypothetical protein E4U42_001149 [Claviceps africana]